MDCSKKFSKPENINHIKRSLKSSFKISLVYWRWDETVQFGIKIIKYSLEKQLQNIFVEHWCLLSAVHCFPVLYQMKLNIKHMLKCLQIWGLRKENVKCNFYSERNECTWQVKIKALCTNVASFIVTEW